MSFVNEKLFFKFKSLDFFFIKVNVNNERIKLDKMNHNNQKK